MAQVQRDLVKSFWSRSTSAYISDLLRFPGTLPETMVSEPGRAPQLRCLCLDGCAVNWTFKFLRSLTHLTIARVSTGCRLSVEGLITNLDNMPQLESIHLSSVMAPAGNSEPNVSSSPSTLLPFIARIHPEDNPTNCLAFFIKFTYPNAAIVSIECFRSDCHPDNIMLLRGLNTVVNAKNIVPITSLPAENPYHGRFRARFIMDEADLHRLPGYFSSLFQYQLGFSHPTPFEIPSSHRHLYSTVRMAQRF